MVSTCLLIGCLGLFPEKLPVERPHSRKHAVDFNGLFARAKRIAEEHLESRVDATLELSERGDGWESQGIGLDMAPFMFWRRADRRVVVSPAQFETFLLKRSKTAKDAEHLGVLLFVHELFHAYQAAAIERLGTRVTSGRWIRFVCEGHAVVSTKMVAQSLRVSDEVFNILRGRKEVRYTGRVEKDRALTREQFYYHLSARFVRDRCSKPSEFPKLLVSPIAYPEVLFCNPGRISPSPRASERLRVLAESAKFADARPVTALDYFEAALLLCPSVFAERDLCEGYRGGALVGCRLEDGSSADVLLLHFRDERSETFAAKVGEYAFLCRRTEQRGRFDLVGGGFRIDNYPDRGRLLYGRLSGGFALFVVVDGGDPGAQFARRCFSQLSLDGKP